MRRVISSKWTLIFKVVVPLVWLAISLFLIFTFLKYSSLPPKNVLIGVILTILATAFFCWWDIKLKRVSVDEQMLYASGLTASLVVLIDFSDTEPAAESGDTGRAKAPQRRRTPKS
jgi:hypothetical protein